MTKKDEKPTMTNEETANLLEIILKHIEDYERRQAHIEEMLYIQSCNLKWVFEVMPLPAHARLTEY